MQPLIYDPIPIRAIHPTPPLLPHHRVVHFTQINAQFGADALAAINCADNCDIATCRPFTNESPTNLLYWFIIISG